MDKPKITWLVKNYSDTSFYSERDYYAGTLLTGNSLIIDLRAWNNRYGTEDTEDLSNFNLCIKFYNVEDMVLLNYLSATLNNSQSLSIESNNDSAVITLPSDFKLSGSSNDGSDNYSDNYMDIRLNITIPEDLNIKLNDIKSMNIDIVEL